MIEDSYYNMREKVVEHPHILDIAQQAMRDCDIEPELKPIRGGTDGAQLIVYGITVPEPVHWRLQLSWWHEFVTLEGMEKSGAGDRPYCRVDGATEVSEKGCGM